MKGTGIFTNIKTRTYYSYTFLYTHSFIHSFIRVKLFKRYINYTSWVAVVTPTDRPKSVRNRCVIELFCGVFCVVTLPFWHFCWWRAFVIWLSQISSFNSIIERYVHMFPLFFRSIVVTYQFWLWFGMVPKQTQFDKVLQIMVREQERIKHCTDFNHHQVVSTDLLTLHRFQHCKEVCSELMKLWKGIITNSVWQSSTNYGQAAKRNKHWTGFSDDQVACSALLTLYRFQLLQDCVFRI